MKIEVKIAHQYFDVLRPLRPDLRVMGAAGLCPAGHTHNGVLVPWGKEGSKFFYMCGEHWWVQAIPSAVAPTMGSFFQLSDAYRALPRSVLNEEPFAHKDTVNQKVAAMIAMIAPVG